MIRFGEPKDIPELKKLWKTCFADEDAYIDAFFEEMYYGKNVLLEEENGALLGASFFLPGEIYLEQPEEEEAGNKTGSTSGKWHWIRYVYALAVYPQFRGRGIAGKLLRRAYEAYNKPLIAEPAEEGLVGGFYKPLGFKETFYLEKTWIEAPQYDVRAAEILPDARDYDIYPARAKEYCRIRDNFFWKHGYVSWPEQHVSFAIREHRCSGGGAFVVSRKEKDDLILYYMEGQDICVTETTLTEQEVIDLFLPWISVPYSRLVLTSEAKQAAIQGRSARQMQQAIGGKSVQRETNVPVAGRNRYLTGMSYGLSSVHGYLNLTLD